ncbi:enoyl-CoA hydratase [Paenibacillus sp. LMG 31460]|uniref:Enoyl-CoA hydratase n=1 Tax=Paenibacillus germinis TaxID=2654979 RepID=A0ABX1Z7T1_9BACL|nr:enoyl-CoA hydratase [Paenibacillus germinis]NOU89347.1 enoyl-CoA hydratase [Paenibacillus germinis]
MEFQKVKVAVRKRIATITVANPPANALNRQTLEELSKVIERVAGDDNIQVIILTGEGKFFIAGAEIKEFTTIEYSQQGEELSKYGQNLFTKIEQLSKPVIAMINGACLGGGLELAMACHVRVAAYSAKIGLPELNLGLIPGYGGTQRLARLTNREKAIELILSSDIIDGEEAHLIGLVSKAVALEELEATVTALAEKITAKSLLTIRAALSAVERGCVEGQEKGLQREAELFGKLFESKDTKEGIQAFLEKRRPIFKDQ